MHNDEIMRQAVEVARALNDMDSIAMHEAFAKQFSRETIQKNLMIALSYPDEKVTSSRAAIYVALMKRTGYGSRYPRR